MGSYPRLYRRRDATDGLGSAHLEVDVPLSEHEQRLLEQIERALVDDDPKFASSVRTGDRRLKARRKLQLGVVLVVVGHGRAGRRGRRPARFRSASSGFLVAFGGAASSASSTTRPPPAPSRPAAARRRPRPGDAGRSGRGGRAGRQPLKNRLEERFRRRYDQ